MKSDDVKQPPSAALRAAAGDPSTALRAAQGEGEEALAAAMSRISASQGFAEDDPRRGPFNAAQARRAVDYLEADDRWHATKGVDLFAVRLQFGRGIRKGPAVRMFGISESVVEHRTVWTGPRKWIPNMSERDRRDLAAHVWLGGLARRLMAGQEADEETLSALKAASEWKRVGGEKLAWLPQDETGEAATMKVHTEIAHDPYSAAPYSAGACSADPYRDERAAVWERLEAELDAIDAAFANEDEGASDDGGAEAQPATAAGAGEAAVADGAAGSVSEPGRHVESVEAVGP